jgi:ppGpp synthetase/RelA/SpoT-type nucleotidyltranferase
MASPKSVPILELRAPVEVIIQFRAAHQYPLTKANNGLRSVVRSESCGVEVSQRLKRLTTIFDKLRRGPQMALARMQDIGGCRAILDSIDEIRRVESRLKKNRPTLRVSDYISQPRASGYRAVHVVVTYEDRAGQDRAIEVQLRTQTMHEWAIAVERFSSRVGEDLKSSRGPEPVLIWLATVSEAMAMEERGETVPAELIEKIQQRRAAAVPYLGEPG